MTSPSRGAPSTTGYDQVVKSYRLGTLAFRSRLMQPVLGLQAEASEIAVDDPRSSSRSHQRAASPNA